MIVKKESEGHKVLHLTTVEAIEIIESLAAQLKAEKADIIFTLPNDDVEESSTDEIDTAPKKSDIWIRNFGNDTRCRTREELKQVLSTQYKFLSVSIRFEASNGKRRVIHVHVDANGIIRDPQSNVELINLDVLFDTQY